MWKPTTPSADLQAHRHVVMDGGTCDPVDLTCVTLVNETPELVWRD